MSFVEAYTSNKLYISSFRHNKITNSSRDVPKIDWKLLIEASAKTNYDVSKLLKKKSPHIKCIDIVKDSGSEDLVNISDNELLSNLHESKNDVLPVMNIPITQHDETSFWRIISSIRCLDKDEGRMTNRSIKLSNTHKKHVLRMLHGKYFAELQHAIVDLPLPFDDEKTIHNFMSHIIAKGKSFYNGILTDPVVCLYLCDNYYPIHDWISS
jgi:hypothetical protein